MRFLKKKKDEKTAEIPLPPPPTPVINTTNPGEKEETITLELTSDELAVLTHALQDSKNLQSYISVIKGESELALLKKLTSD